MRIDKYAGWIFSDGTIINLEHNVDHATMVLKNAKQFGMPRKEVIRIKKLKGPWTKQYEEVKDFMFNQGAIRFWVYGAKSMLFEMPEITSEYLSKMQQYLQSNPPGADTVYLDGYFDKQTIKYSIEDATWGDLVPPGRRPSIRDIPGAYSVEYESKRFISQLDRKISLLEHQLRDNPQDEELRADLRACKESWALLTSENKNNHGGIMIPFENKLDKVLGLVAEDNDFSTGSADAKPVELDGKKRKSAKSVHRPDPPTEYNEFKAEDEFQNNPHNQSEQARPDLTSDYD